MIRLVNAEHKGEGHPTHSPHSPRHITPRLAISSHSPLHITDL